MSLHQPPRGDPVLQGREESGLGRPAAKPIWVAIERNAIFCRLLPGQPIRVLIEVFLCDTSHCPLRTNINICSRACDRCLLSEMCRFCRWRSGMAYGKGQSKDLIKKAVELGTLPTSADLSSLRSSILEAVGTMAASIWPNDILQPIPHGKEIDAVMLRVQSELSKGGLNSVWGEKARLLAKSAVLEQWKRAQRNLIGRFKNVGQLATSRSRAV